MEKGMYYYSKNTKLFYPVALRLDYEAAHTLPDDCIEVDASIFNEFTGCPPDGKILSFDNNEMPMWHDAPPLSHEQNIAVLTNKKNQLMVVANATIAPLQDAIDFNIATEDETQRLNDWRLYRVLLNRIDTSLVSDITWPEIPTH